MTASTCTSKAAHIALSDSVEEVLGLRPKMQKFMELSIRVLYVRHRIVASKLL